jgi:hypothetical protein
LLIMTTSEIPRLGPAGNYRETLSPHPNEKELRLLAEA